MTLFLLHTPTTTHFTKLAITISCTSSKPPHKKPHHQQKVPPARDRVIDFGRHKGKPLGSLPSTYLKWVCRNLRTGDSLHWAELADQVLQDPVYKDRIEWELAENLLTGNVNRNSSESSMVSRLVEVSERFGWDNDDKLGWSKVDFQLLGTSHGGRIPRKVEGRMGKPELKMVEEEEARKVLLSGSEERRRERRTRRVRGKMAIRDNVRGSFGSGEKSVDQDLTVEIKSEDRRLRVIRDKLGIKDNGKGSVGNVNKIVDDDDSISGGGQNSTVGSEESRLNLVRDKMGIKDNGRGSFGIGEKSGDDDGTEEINSAGRMMTRVRDKMGMRDNVKGSFENGKKSGDDDDVDQDRTVEIKSPFPGREALLKKVLRSRRFL